MMMQVIINSRQKNAGSMTVELMIIVAALVFPLVLGTVEIARVLYTYNTLLKNVREGARYMSIYSATSGTYATAMSEAQCLVAFGNKTCAGTSLAPGLTKGMVSVTSTTVTPGGGATPFPIVEVAINNYKLSYISQFFGANAGKSYGKIAASMRQTTS